MSEHDGSDARKELAATQYCEYMKRAHIESQDGQDNWQDNGVLFTLFIHANKSYMIYMLARCTSRIGV